MAVTLFVAGPLDGKLIDVNPNRMHVEVAIEHPIEINTLPDKAPNKLTDVFFYKREILQCPSLEVSVFVPRSYTCPDLVLALINGYHQSINQMNEIKNSS